MHTGGGGVGDEIHVLTQIITLQGKRNGSGRVYGKGNLIEIRRFLSLANAVFGLFFHLDLGVGVKGAARNGNTQMPRFHFTTFLPDIGTYIGRGLLTAGRLGERNVHTPMHLLPVLAAPQIDNTPSLLPGGILRNDDLYHRLVEESPVPVTILFGPPGRIGRIYPERQGSSFGRKAEGGRRRAQRQLRVFQRFVYIVQDAETGCCEQRKERR